MRAVKSFFVLEAGWSALTFSNSIIHPHYLPDARLFHGSSSDREVGVEDVQGLFAHQRTAF